MTLLPFFICFYLDRILKFTSVLPIYFSKVTGTFLQILLNKDSTRSYFSRKLKNFSKQQMKLLIISCLPGWKNLPCHSSLVWLNNNVLVLSNLLHLYFIVICSLHFRRLEILLTRSSRENYHSSPNSTTNCVVTLTSLQPTLAF